MHVFPDAVLWATGYYREALATAFPDDVFVGDKVPNPRHDYMVVVNRRGGVALDRFRDRPRLAVRVFGPTEEDATRLAGVVRALTLAAPGNGPVRAVRESGGLDEADDVQPARLLSYDLTTRGVPL